VNEEYQPLHYWKCHLRALLSDNNRKKTVKKHINYNLRETLKGLRETSKKIHRYKDTCLYKFES
jgi:predicted chitinase